VHGGGRGFRAVVSLEPVGATVQVDFSQREPGGLEPALDVIETVEQSAVSVPVASGDINLDLKASIDRHELRAEAVEALDERTRQRPRRGFDAK